MKHFPHVDKHVGDIPDHPIFPPERIGGFWVSDISDFIYVPFDSETRTPIMSHFWCDKCSRWYCFHSSLGNIHHHLRCKHQACHTEISPSFIKHAIYSFILTNGLPFRLIEDQYLSQLLQFKVSRQQIANDCDRVAQIIDHKLSAHIQNFTHSVGVFDEWTDNASRPYIGITLHGILEIDDEKYDHQMIVVGHIPIKQIHSTHEAISETIKNRFDELQIAIPNIFVTDAGSTCEPAIHDLHSHKRECWGHILNLMLKDIHEELKTRLPEIFNVQKSFGKSSVFHAYMEQNGASRFSIPSYVETRFYSMSKLFEVIYIMFDDINQFGIDNNYGLLLPEEYKPYVESANSLLQTFKSVIEKLESDKFGSLSYVLPGIKMLQASAEQIRETYPELYVAFDGSFILHINPILLNPKKKNRLLVASILNPSLHHPSFFTEDEMNIGYDIIREKLPSFIERTSSSQPINWSNFSPPRSQSPLEAYKRIATNFPFDTADLKKFWLTDVDDQLKPLVPIAIEYLLIPSTNTSSERLFSKARNVLSLNRLCIGQERASNAVICAANPVLAEEAISEVLEN